MKGSKGLLFCKAGSKAVIAALLFTGMAAAASAQVTISAGFALSSVKEETDGIKYDSEVGVGGNIYADWLLPIRIPLSLGLEVGFDTSPGAGGYDGLNWNMVIPILLRVAYHFDLLPKLDLYLVGKIGYALSWWQDVDSYFDGVGFGADLGVAYYFTPHFGLFAEVGYDGYFLEGKANYEFWTADGVHYYGGPQSVKLPFARYFTIGISTKF